VILQPANAATPLAAVTGLAVQVSVAPVPGWVAMARVTGLELPVTGLPAESSTVTFGWVAQADPLAPPPGWVVNASCAAAPAVTVMVCWTWGAAV